MHGHSGGMWWLNGWGTAITAPGPPTAAVATNILTSSFTANWSAGSGDPSGYFLDVATDEAFTSFVAGYNGLEVPVATSARVTGVSPGTTYYYRVRAFNGAGVSANSGKVLVTTGGTISVLQSQGGQAADTGAPTHTITLPGNGTLGSYIVAVAATWHAATNGNKINDVDYNGDLNFTMLSDGVDQANNIHVSIWGYQNNQQTASAPSVVARRGAGSDDITMYVMELSGAPTSGQVRDIFNAATGNSAAASVGTGTTAEELLFLINAVVADQAGITMNDPDYTSRFTYNNTANVSMGVQTRGSYAGPTSDTATATVGAGSWGSVIVALKAAQGSSSLLETTVDTPYNVAAQVQKQSESAYNVASHVQKQLETAYQLAAQVQRQLETGYDTAAQIQKQVEASYQTAAQIQAQASTQYQSAVQVQKGVEAAYTTGVLVQIVASTSYQVAAQIQQTVESAYSTAAHVEKRLDAPYDVAAHVQAGRSAAYQVAMQVQKALDTQYATAAQIERGVETSYLTAAQAQARVDTSYQVGAQVQRLAEAAYNSAVLVQIGIERSYQVAVLVEVAAAGQVDTAYQTALQVQKQVEASYSTAVQVEKSLDTAYNVASQVQKGSEAKYAAAMQVQRALSHPYDVASQVQAERKIAYEVAAAVQQTVEMAYQAGVLVQVRREVAYLVAAWVQVERQLTYQVAAHVQTSASATYLTACQVEAGVQLAYQVAVWIREPVVYEPPLVINRGQGAFGRASARTAALDGVSTGSSPLGDVSTGEASMRGVDD